MHMGSWEVCAWYMGGVALHQLYGVLSFYRKPVDDRTQTIYQCLAAKTQGLIVGFAVSWLWVSGQLWDYLAHLGEQVPVFSSITPIDADALSSIMAGFLMEWVVIQRVVAKFGIKK